MADIQSMPELNTAILPIFQRYKQENESWTPGLGVLSYLNLRADFDLAAAFSKLFWSDFVEVEGCVLLREHYSAENFNYWLAHYGGNGRATEAMINHLHISDLFLNSPTDVEYTDQLLEYLVNALAFGWKQALVASFPDKQFVFTIRHNNGPEISFHQAFDESASG